MKAKLLIASLIAATSTFASAGEYVCKVYCKNPSGTATVEVTASSAYAAAAMVDKRSDQVCQAEGYGKSTTTSMSASQCSSK
jgi:hypothetical protein